RAECHQHNGGIVCPPPPPPQPACQAAYDGDLHRLYNVLKTDPTKLNVQDPESGETPLVAACRGRRIKVVRYLLDLKADVHLTSKVGFPDDVRASTQFNGVRPSAPQKRRTCLHYTSRITFTLLDYLMIAILMPILLGYLIMKQKQKQSVELMQAVLSSGVSVNATDYKGNTALHYACQRKSRHLVPLLLQQNAKTNIRNADGETPLDIALRLKFTKISNMLRKAA
uniref:Ankyrin repeat domain 22 n=1 Tax=Oryzias latipes TaxID=8090 RepID=A0A3P9KJ46_ORYLA